MTSPTVRFAPRGQGVMSSPVRFAPGGRAVRGPWSAEGTCPTPSYPRMSYPGEPVPDASQAHCRRTDRSADADVNVNADADAIAVAVAE